LNVPETEELLAAFKLKHHTVIERRNAEAMERTRSGGHPVMPVLAEMKIKSRTNLGQALKGTTLALSYSDGGSLAEIKRRPDQWREHPEVSVERAGGMSDAVAFPERNRVLANKVESIQ
jgi:hypothetical protein